MLKSELSEKLERAKFIELIFIVSSISIVFTIYFSLSFNYPPIADGATVADIVKYTAQTNQIHGVHPYALATPKMNMPLFYPQLFFILGAVFNLFIGDISFDLIQSLSGALILLSLYILARYLCGKKVAILATIISISSYYLMELSTKMEQEPTLFFLMVLFIYCFFKLVKSGERSWIFINSIILAGAIGLKQQGSLLFFLIIITLALYPLLKEWKKYKNIMLNCLIMLSITVIIVSPVLFYQFSTTGTLLYPGGTPQPIIKMEEKLAKIIGVQKYQLNPNWLEYGRDTSWGSSRIKEASLQGIIDNTNPFGGHDIETIQRLFFIIFFFLATIYILKSKHFEFLVILLFIVLLLTLYAFLIPIWDYFIIVNILASITLAFSISMFLDYVQLHNKKIIPVIVMMIIFISIIPVIGDYQYLQQKSVEANKNMAEYDKMGLWIKKNTPEDAIILTSRTTEVSYRSERKTIWFNLIDGTEIYDAFNSGNETRLINALNDYGVDYVLITEWWTGNPKEWINFMSSKGTRIVKESDNFKQVYQTDRVSLYKLKLKRVQ